MQWGGLLFHHSGKKLHILKTFMTVKWCYPWIELTWILLDLWNLRSCITLVEILHQATNSYLLSGKMVGWKVSCFGLLIVSQSFLSSVFWQSHDLPLNRKQNFWWIAHLQVEDTVLARSKCGPILTQPHFESIIAQWVPMKSFRSPCQKYFFWDNWLRHFLKVHRDQWRPYLDILWTIGA